MDSVNYRMESMIPELKDLVKRKLFTNHEVKQIAKKRREFEIKLGRRVSIKNDFLRYIEYESTLHALKQKRLKRLGGLLKRSELDFESLRIIYGIFDRAIRKFGANDLRLWYSYIEIAKANGSEKVVSRVLARAIQIHPLVDHFWILAADWEYSQLGNASAARVLLQRGLRLNSESTRLWCEYYRFECHYLQTIRKRREILGLSTNMETLEDAKEAEVVVPDLEQEQEVTDTASPSSEIKESNSAAKETFLSGSILEIVLQNALKAIPENFEFSKQLMSITKSFSGTQSVQEKLYQIIYEKFRDEAKSRAFLAERFVCDYTKEHPEFSSRLKETLQEYSQAIEELGSSDMLESAIAFIFNLIEDFGKGELRDVLENHALDIFGYAQERNWLSEDLYHCWIQVLERRIKPDSNEDVAVCVHVCNMAVHNFPVSKKLWLKRLQLAILPFDSWSLPISVEVLEIIRGVFVKAIPAGCFEIWRTFIGFCVSRKEDFALEIGKQHLLQMMKEDFVKGSDEMQAKFRNFLVSDVFPCLNDDRDILPMFESVAQAKPTSLLYSLWIDVLLAKYSCLKQGKGLGSVAMVKEIRLLFEKCLLLDEKCHDNWTKFIRFEMEETGDFTQVSSLHERAKLALGCDLIVCQ